MIGFIPVSEIPRLVISLVVGVILLVAVGLVFEYFNSCWSDSAGRSGIGIRILQLSQRLGGESVFGSTCNDMRVQLLGRRTHLGAHPTKLILISLFYGKSKYGFVGALLFRRCRSSVESP